jgi:hypothetical protein
MKSGAKALILGQVEPYPSGRKVQPDLFLFFLFYSTFLKVDFF